MDRKRVLVKIVVGLVDHQVLHFLRLMVIGRIEFIRHQLLRYFELFSGLDRICIGEALLFAVCVCIRCHFEDQIVVLSCSTLVDASDERGSYVFDITSFAIQYFKFRDIRADPLVIRILEL